MKHDRHRHSGRWWLLQLQSGQDFVSKRNVELRIASRASQLRARTSTAGIRPDTIFDSEIGRSRVAIPLHSRLYAARDLARIPSPPTAISCGSTDTTITWFIAQSIVVRSLSLNAGAKRWFILRWLRL